MEILNRVARHNYTIEEEIECGIALSGTEIKSIRDGKANLKDSYGMIRNHEAYLLNMYIAPYKEGNIFNHQERRTRKLLLHKKQILKWYDKIRLEGYTLVPLKVYLVKNRAKILMGLAKGKKNYDKRESMKERDMKRQMAQANKTRL